MFTGLVETTGKVLQQKPEGLGYRLTIETEKPLADIKIGDSIAVNGVCLTVEKIKQTTFSVFILPETVRSTTLGKLQESSILNLERAMPANGRFGGHIVQGHVEGIATVKNIIAGQNFQDIFLVFQSPYIIPKGSIALDGISLTVQEVQKEYFRVQIIPETIRNTNIPFWKENSIVNVETDYLVKALDYIRKYNSNQTGNAIS